MTFETIDTIATVIVAIVFVAAITSAVISWTATKHHDRHIAKAKRRYWEAEANKITAHTSRKETE